jgi:hypothetical protein
MRRPSVLPVSDAESLGSLEVGTRWMSGSGRTLLVSAFPAACLTERTICLEAADRPRTESARACPSTWGPSSPWGGPSSGARASPSSGSRSRPSSRGKSSSFFHGTSSPSYLSAGTPPSDRAWSPSFRASLLIGPGELAEVYPRQTPRPYPSQVRSHRWPS